MIISRLSIQNFRNIHRCDLSPHHKINFLTGNNAQGKSNFLEALGILTSGRSFRRARENELIRWNERFARIESEIIDREEPFQVAFTLAREKEHMFKKRIQLNGHALSRLSQFIGKVKTVPFSRYDLDTITGPPIERRRFIDMILSFCSSKYLYALQQYHIVLKERNNWLKSAPQKANVKIAEVWEEQLAQYGSLLLQERIRMISTLKKLSLTIFEKLSPEEGPLNLSYRSTVPHDPPDKTVIYHGFLESFKKHRKQEEEIKTTLIGPHRDDLSIHLKDISLRAFGSQGQQRLAALTLKFAEADFIESISGTTPIILLDDCFSELDDPRIERIWMYLQGKGQIFITSNSMPGGTRCLGDTFMYKVEEGEVIPVV